MHSTQRLCTGSHSLASPTAGMQSFCVSQGMQNGKGELFEQTGGTSSGQPPSPRQGKFPEPPPGGMPKRPPPPALALPPPPRPALAEAAALPPSPPPPKLGAPELGAPELGAPELGALSDSRSKVSWPQPGAMLSAQSATANATVRAELDGARLITPELTTFLAVFRWSACCFVAQVLSSPRCLAARDFVPIRGSASFHQRASRRRRQARPACWCSVRRPMKS